jgi:integrase
MPRKTRSSRIETRTARLKLAVANKPYDFTAIAPRAGLGYRRNAKGAGAWVLRQADGKGGYQTRNVGLADDLQDADGAEILTWFQAIEQGRKLTKGDDTIEPSAILTVAGAVDDYARDLAARGAGAENATRIRKHLTATLASRPVGLLNGRELRAWRDELLKAGMPQVTLVRLMRAVKAALNLAAKNDRSIANRAAWSDGLSGVKEDFASRNIERLDDDQVRAVIEACAALDPNLGLYVEVAAETGARPSQISRLVVGDLQNGGTPRLMMPAGRKGRGSAKASHYPVPITLQLAAKLKSERAPSAPLLIRSDGRRWQETDLGDYANLFERAIAGLGLDMTFYALRHSMIVRLILAGVPLRLVAASADTSTVMIERTYKRMWGISPMTWFGADCSPRRPCRPRSSTCARGESKGAKERYGV